MGRRGAILLTQALPSSLAAGPCVALDGMAPLVCGVLAEFGLTPATFAAHAKDAVPANDTSRQAPCEPLP